MNKKWLLGIILSIVLVLGLTPVVCMTARADVNLNGSGTEGDPYRIGTIEELKSFRTIVNTSTEAFWAKLTADIDLGGNANESSTWWTPIGAPFFNGVFDGQGHTISNLYVKLEGVDNAFGGLFRTNIGTIKNLCVSGDVRASGNSSASAGGIAASIQAGRIENCRTAVTVEASNSTTISAGGIVGAASNSDTIIISNCSSSGTVSASTTGTGNAFAGGIVGHGVSGSVTYCYSTSAVTVNGGTAKIGGVAGDKDDYHTIITNCYYNTTTAGNSVTGAVNGANTNTVKGLTADECKDSSKFVGFNFNNDWFMGESGPKLWATDAVSVSTWPDLYSALQTNVNGVRLTADVSAPASEKLTVPSGKTVTLDLCGHTITGNGNEPTNVCTEVLLVHGTLTLTDSGTTPRYGIWNTAWSTYTLSTAQPASGDYDVFPTGGVITGGATIFIGGGVYVEADGSFIMKGGAIAGNRTTGSGGGLYVGRDGAATLDGGMICGNYAKMGGGVCVVGGSFELKSGMIGRNIAEQGGGVHVMGTMENDTPQYGVFTMNGGSIAGNKATSSTYGGGGVCISHIDLSPGGTFTMNAGTIENNKATSGNGGGVLVTQRNNVGDKNSTFTMTGGTITGNSASSDSSDGGGVYVNTGCEFQLSVGAEITTNTAGSDGGGVYVNTGGNFQPADGAKITGNTAGGEVDNVYYDKVKETTPAAAFNATGVDTGTLSGLTSGMKYSLDGGSTWTDIANNADINLTGLSACTIQVVKKGNGTTTIDSDAKEITVTKSETPTEPVAVKCTSQKNNDGKITGVTVEMEYMKSDGTVWTAGTGNDITGLVPGTYYVRTKPNGTALASENQTLTISGYTAPPTPTPPTPAKPTADVKTAPTSNTLTYDGQPHALITAGESTGGEMLYALGESNSSMPTSGWSTSIPTAADAGTYYVWYKTKADKSHKDSSPKCVTVTIGKGSSTITTPPTVEIKTLIDNGEPQELITAGEATGGTMQYAIGTDPTTAPTDGWSTEIPKVTDPGTYYIWYKVLGDNDHEDTEPSYAGTATIIENHSDNALAIDEEKGIATVRDAVSGGTTEVPLYVITEGLTYRMYDPNRGEHFYTKNPEEVEGLVNLGWIHESGSDFTVVSATEEDAAPVYRLYNPNCGGMHFYTTDAEEAKYLKNSGWNYEGISHYVYTASSTKGTPQHRLYNPNSLSGEHLWTSDLTEVNTLIEEDWKYEGICWRIV